MSKRTQKMYVVRKYVMAESVSSALRKERKVKPHEVFVDEDWRKQNKDRLADAIGFYQLPPNYRRR